jgi:hypothetical protein
MDDTENREVDRGEQLVELGKRIDGRFRGVLGQGSAARGGKRLPAAERPLRPHRDG